ncbi:MAG: hypothetical protein DME26_14545 [Verrucomicrobia bacterium]|nr:MAG: hypothetical protein DME26_14545 [Verrucomicrobiota bacterium]
MNLPVYFAEEESVAVKVGCSCYGRPALHEPPREGTRPTTCRPDPPARGFMVSLREQKTVEATHKSDVGIPKVLECASPPALSLGRRAFQKRRRTGALQDAGAPMVVCARSSPCTRRFPSSRGFTLIETIGVLTILAILATVLTVSVVKRVDQGASAQEATNLVGIADSYTRYVLKNKTIPNHVTWATNVATEMAQSVAAIKTTPRGFARAFLIDTNLSIGGAGLPYTQTTNGTAQPVSARVMIVSSVASALPLSSGIPTSTEFNAIWDTAEGAKPSTGTWTSWAGNGGDLHIKRLNLEPLFYQLILIDHSTNAGAAKFSIDGSAVVEVPNPPLGWNSYYLDGTALGLHDTNTVNAATVLRTRHLITYNISFVFESEGWRGFLTGGQNAYTMSDAFAKEAKEFFDARWNSGVNNGASQYGVMVAMYSFLYEYTLWANECPHFSRHGATGSNPTSVPEYDMLNNLGQNNGALDKYSDDNTGLLK